jgi:hypothetical protein
MNKSLQVLEMMGVLKPSNIDSYQDFQTGDIKKDYPGFDWDKIFMGDFHLFQVASSQTGRWRTGNAINARQSSSIADSAKNWKKNRTRMGFERELKTTTTLNDVDDFTPRYP